MSPQPATSLARRPLTSLAASPGTSSRSVLSLSCTSALRVAAHNLGILFSFVTALRHESPWRPSPLHVQHACPGYRLACDPHQDHDGRKGGLVRDDHAICHVITCYDRSQFGNVKVRPSLTWPAPCLFVQTTVRNPTGRAYALQARPWAGGSQTITDSAWRWPRRSGHPCRDGRSGCARGWRAEWTEVTVWTACGYTRP
jgi:hypothetical protein